MRLEFSSQTLLLTLEEERCFFFFFSYMNWEGEATRLAPRIASFLKSLKDEISETEFELEALGNQTQRTCRSINGIDGNHRLTSELCLPGVEEMYEHTFVSKLE